MFHFFDNSDGQFKTTVIGATAFWSGTTSSKRWPDGSTAKPWRPPPMVRCVKSIRGDPLGVVRERVGKNLERDLATELGVLRAVHLTHAPAAEEAQDFVSAEPSADCERHC